MFIRKTRSCCEIADVIQDVLGKFRSEFFYSFASELVVAKLKGEEPSYVFLEQGLRRDVPMRVYLRFDGEGDYSKVFKARLIKQLVNVSIAVSSI